MLRAMGIFTLVGKDDQCLSACVFVFMGGERRVVAGGRHVVQPVKPLLERALSSCVNELPYFNGW